jgi:hypothetical protein
MLGQHAALGISSTAHGSGVATNLYSSQVRSESMTTAGFNVSHEFSPQLNTLLRFTEHCSIERWRGPKCKNHGTWNGMDTHDHIQLNAVLFPPTPDPKTTLEMYEVYLTLPPKPPLTTTNRQEPIAEFTGRVDCPLLVGICALGFSTPEFAQQSTRP